MSHPPSAAISLSQLESHLWEAANILRGPVDAADFKTYVFPLLFFKRVCDVHDEEYRAALEESGDDEEYARFPQHYRFQVPETCHWQAVRAVATNVGQALQTAMRGIEQANPETLYGIFGDAQWTNKERLPDALLRDLIEHFSCLDLGNRAAQADVLGQSYEYLIKKFADLTNKKAGEFYTPRSVVRLMVNLLDPRPGESIYDPACGTGGLLLEAIHHVRAAHGDDRMLWGKLSSHELSLANLPEDALGQGYEYLIKKFADDSGHTAAEFYTNRTVVHLMTELLAPQPGESIYDPTCGSGGMLLSAVAHLRRQNREWRNVRLFGQERNLMTSSIARMNCFLHGIEDFQIVRGDTLAEPKLVEGDRLRRFDVVLANPPYSIKQWDQNAFKSDPWGRNRFGVPPQGRADYAFWQHILASLSPGNGRCAILFPHGVLFRQEEAEMRRRLVEADAIEAVIGLGPNLFYNSPMEACVVVGRTARPPAQRGRILFVNAVAEVTRERAQSFLTDEHLARIVAAYRAFEDVPGFARVATLEEVRARDGNLSIPLYVAPAGANVGSDANASSPVARPDLATALGGWLESSLSVRESLGGIFDRTTN